MEKGNAVDPAGALAAGPVVQGVGERLTTAVVDVTTETADSLRGKLIETAVDEARERIRDKPADDDTGAASPRPDGV